MKTVIGLIAGITMLPALFAPCSALAATDTTPPSTQAVVSGTLGSDGWYKTSVTVTLTATDGVGGSGVAKTEYSLDNATWQTYSGALLLATDGARNLYYRSVDAVGNVEPAKLQPVKINQSGLVGNWRLDGDYKDSSVVGSNGTAVNGAAFNANAKVGTQAGSFDGIDDYVTIPHSDTLNPLGSQTIAFWVYFNSLPNAYKDIIQKGIGSGKTQYYIRTNSAGGLDFWLRGTARDYAFTPSTTPFTSYASLGITAASWHHVAFVVNDNTRTAYVYVDGVQRASSAGTPVTAVQNTSPLTIGGFSWDGYFNGLIDDVSIYNRALSDTEIKEYYRNYVVHSPTVNPVASPTAMAVITLSGTKPADSAVVVNGNTIVPLDGATSWTGNYTPAQGTNSISVTARDSENRDSLPAALSVFVDAVPPQVTATVPSANATLAAPPAVVAFTFADQLSPLDMAASLSAAEVTNAAGYKVSGTWSSTVSGGTGSAVFTPASSLRDGTYRAAIRPVDALGNGSTYVFSFTVDTTPPAVPGINPVGTVTNTKVRTVTGTRSSDSASVIVGCATAAVGPVSYPTATTWNAYVSGLGEGGNTITAYAVDAAGNASAAAEAIITVDTTPPAVYAAPAGGVYNSARTIVLTASEPGVIRYTTDGSAPGAGSAIYSAPVAIPESATLRYFAVDAAGNAGEILTERYVIDATPPTLAVSTLSDGAFTNNEVLNISGTVTDNTGVGGLVINDTAVPVNPDGSFSHAFRLNAGLNTIRIVAEDMVGNRATETRGVILDQSAPVIIVAMPADNSKTGTPLMQVTGKVDKTAAVTVKKKDVVQNAVMDGGGFISAVALDPGFNTIEITATDLAGNQSSLKRTAVFEDQAPSLAVTEPNQDIRTNEGRLVVRGTGRDDLTAVAVTVQVDNDVYTPALVDGAFEQVVNLTGEKTYGIVVTATNEVGRSVSVQRNVIYDVTPPLLGVDEVASPTTQSGITLTGTREAGIQVAVTCATATVGEITYPSATTWQVAVSNLQEGKNAITAASVDAAGNAVTVTKTVVLATRPPEITLLVTPDVIWPPNGKRVPVTIKGGVEVFGPAVKSVSISLSDEYGKYNYRNLSFGSTVMVEASRKGNDRDGRKYTISVVVTDAAGKKIAKTATVTVPASQGK
ncbi:OmpL47-type beta-barrel domain-containing protein [Geomonas propionica]|uniref:Chitobiase/beta-hexosaminidase C-terminal domain-containing protein n=1 Tax=Geomonas propionica TaxID=2798582 RepID=A0ABS0YLK3_9BACT|nr:LamG-like jellyroll fold domain-containing protein [Geomonas propionica]MBJ6798789.1 chitobiase/beta-hexosaminidase C-terminal domain-containing protein [Geomonas propionica]